MTDRPVVVVVATLIHEDRTVLLVAPVTHRRPIQGNGVEVPQRVKRHLGLDDERSWIVTTEFNRFVWPGPDVRTVKGKTSPLHGAIPAKLFEQARAQILAHRTTGRTTVVKRTD
jgi:hypothetical protein